MLRRGFFLKGSMKNLSRHLRLQADFSERSYYQWLLMRCLAFGERDWMLAASVLFVIDKNREFLSIPGFVLFMAGLIFMGPVFGILIFYNNKALYLYRKRRGTLPADFKGLKRMSLRINLYWLPFVFAFSYYGFNLFYETYADLTKPLTSISTWPPSRGPRQ